VERHGAQLEADAGDDEHQAEQQDQAARLASATSIWIRVISRLPVAP